MSHRTRERPAECLASLSHSTMIGLLRAQLELVHSLQMYCKLFLQATDTEQSSDEVEYGILTPAPQQPRGRIPSYIGKDQSIKWLMHKPLPNRERGKARRGAGEGRRARARAGGSGRESHSADCAVRLQSVLHVHVRDLLAIR
ncbi:hypothetical protein EVAR_43282_1 [Eumeta japonica]|uniref:Uncharacterized protein n=1 Tax=Eumeta variegata TaxID=151549 RepID=A0A4C1WZJ5_EUMVA|nr:hypothetical protein EVAR_43282_1 [Eumeta japonica]